MPLAAKQNPVLGTYNSEAAPGAVFRFLKPISATIMPQPFSSYRPPRLVKGKRWYIEYWYRVPESLRNQYPKDFERFRVFEDINRHKSDEYANLLLKAVEDRLRDGYSPFAHEKVIVTEGKQTTRITLNYALEQFSAYCIDKGLREKTLQNYGTTINYLQEYFLKGNRIYEPLITISKDDIKKFIAHIRKEKKLGNTTVNNYVSFLRVIFNWFVREEWIEKSPVKIETLPQQATRHTYYTDAIAKKLKDLMKQSSPELYQFCQFIYYTATRPKSEARFLQVKHILFDRKLLFVPASISKNKKDDYIPIGAELLKMLADRKKQPADYYIFGGNKNRSANYFSQLYKPYKDKLGLNENYTIYSWKHSRAIHLADAGANPYDIMKLFRHSSLEITMKYLRDLGLNISSEIHDKSRKF
jgi:integrase